MESIGSIIEEFLQVKRITCASSETIKFYR